MQTSTTQTTEMLEQIRLRAMNRPPIPASAYVIRLNDDGLWPGFRKGFGFLVDPTRAVETHDPVVVVARSRDGEQITLFLRYGGPSEDDGSLRFFHVWRELSIPRERIVQMHLVVVSYGDYSGISKLKGLPQVGTTPGGLDML